MGCTGAIGVRDAIDGRVSITSRLKPKTDECGPGVRWTRADLGALAFLLALATVAIWAGPRIGGGIARFDTFAFFLPMYSFLGDSLGSGNIPGWNP